MEATARADTFFLVTTIAVVAVTAALVVVLWYVVRILADIRGFSKKIKKEGDEVVEDVHSLRMSIKKEGKKSGEAVSRFIQGSSSKKNNKK